MFIFLFEKSLAFLRNISKIGYDKPLYSMLHSGNHKKEVTQMFQNFVKLYFLKTY